MTQPEGYQGTPAEIAELARRYGASVGDNFARAVLRGGVVDLTTEERPAEFELVGENLYLRRTTRIYTATVTEKRVMTSRQRRAES